LAVPAERAAIAEPAALAAVAVPGRAATVVWAWQASVALVAVAALAALAGMRTASATAQQVVMPGRAALVERAALLARLARTPRPCSAVLAGLAVTLVSLVVARRVSVVPVEQSPRVTALPAALAEPAARVAMLEPAALAAVVLLGLAATVVWVRRVSAALVVVAVLAAPGSMRAVSATAQQVVMLGRAALVERAALLARLARTPRPCSAGLAGLAVMLE
jgi:hypothetical protein